MIELTAGGAARRGRPRKADAARRNHAFLDYCLKQFLTHGYRSTTMDGLARGFGAGKSTLYAHYGSKAGLVRAAMERGVPPLLESLAKVKFDAHTAPRDVLRTFGTLIENYAFDPGIRAMWRAVSEAREELDGLEEVVSDLSQRVLAPLSAYFASMHDAGVLNCPDPDQTARAFSELASGGLNTFLGVPASGPARTERLEFMIALFMDGIAPRREIELVV